jgi:Predicted transcriptional regulator
MQINRLFEIVYILMNKKITTAKELSEHFEVSQRTIYRDIDTLCEAGIPIYTNKGKGGGIALMENFVLNKSILTDREQSEILTALQGLKATNYTETDQVISKLSSLFGNKNTNWIEVDFSYWSSNEEDKTKFLQLKDSILDHKIIEFNYYNSYGQESHRTIEPRKLIFKGQAWYLSGYCLDKEDFRFFKISRIKSLITTTKTFEPRAENDTKYKEPRMPDSPVFQLVLKIDQTMAFRIYDEFPEEAVVTNTDGSFLVHTSFQAGNWIYGYLMSYEDHIEILEPSEIREQMKLRYKNALKKYDV